MTQTPHELAEVEELLAERDAIHGWLARLDAAGSDAPESVRARVRRDYEVRMDGLTERLRVHADAVAGKLQDDRAEHVELAQRATAAREALAEAELRHLVGEYEGGRYQEERTRHSSDLETFELSLEAAAERIHRLEEVHHLIASAPKVVPIGGAFVPPTAEAPIPDSVPESGPVAEQDEFEILIDTLAPDDQEEILAALEEVESLPSSGSPFGTPLSEFAPLSFRPSGNTPVEPTRPTTSPVRQGTPPLGMPAESSPRFVRPGEETPPPQPEASVEMLFENDIVAGPSVEPSTNIAGRTLRCGECGAMNRALEWYCEKCGAELTAL